MTKIKHLISTIKKTGGRNRTGRITVRHIGGGHKQKYRKVGLFSSPGIWEVVKIEYDPIRTANIALMKKIVNFEIRVLDENFGLNKQKINDEIKITDLNELKKMVLKKDFSDKNISNDDIFIYELAENEMKEGQKIINLSGITKLNNIIKILLNEKVSSHDISIKGSIIPLKYIPLGTTVYGIQNKVGFGIKGKFLRAAGMKGTIIKVNTYNEPRPFLQNSESMDEISKIGNITSQIDQNHQNDQNQSFENTSEINNNLIKFIMTNFKKSEILIEQKITKPNIKPIKWYNSKTDHSLQNVSLDSTNELITKLNNKDLHSQLIKINSLITQSKNVLENSSFSENDKNSSLAQIKNIKNVSNTSKNLTSNKNLNNALIEVVSYGSLNNETKKTKGVHSRTKIVRYLTINSDCGATIGTISNCKHVLSKLYKAGQKRWMGIRPTVRGEAMNAVDHPHGGRTRGGRVPKTAFGKLAHGGRTASKLSKRITNK